MGPVAELLLVVQPPLVVLASAVVAWIRGRHSDVDITITKPDGSTKKISAKHVRQVSPQELGPLVSQLVQELDDAGRDQGEAGGS